MKIKTGEATPLQLNWLVAKCEGLALYEDANLNGVDKKGWWISGRVTDPNYWVPLTMYNPSINWSLGGPIIDKEGIDLAKMNGGWMAQIIDSQRKGYAGPTPLIAVMRCYVASKLGDEVDVPEELV